MKKNIYLILVSLILLLTVMFFITAINADAALYDRGRGLIYDDALDITWMQDANTNGTMSWDEAMSWADNLTFANYNDWRLPASDILCSGSDCLGSEMVHLFYIDGITPSTPGTFTNVQNYMYWSSSESNELSAFRFNMRYGTQGTSAKDQPRYGWAVRDGDSPVAPEPISSLLFIVGAITLGAKRLKRK